MSPSRWSAILGPAVLCALASVAQAQQRGAHIGYVYPAGGQRGATFDAVIGGQFLTGLNGVDVSGGGVRAEIVELIQPIAGKELNALRIKLDELQAKRAVIRNDARALEAFRSFKNAKTDKAGEASHDQQLEKLKAKYAGATWTAADEALLNETRKKIGTAVRRPANPAISEIAVVRFTVTPDAEPGPRELRITTPSTLSNPLAFCIGQLPEVSAKAAKNITEQKSAIAKTAIAPRNRTASEEQEVTLPAVVNGQILAGKVNRFRFAAHQNQRLVITASARELIPYIPDAVPGWFQATLAVYDAHGKELAYDDDFRFNPDPVLYFQVPADGDYVVEIKDAIYRGREDFVYRITIGELPFVTSIFPLGGPAGSQTEVEVDGWNLPATRLTVDNRDRPPGVYPLAEHNQQWTSNPVPFAVDTLPECLEQEPNDQQAHAQQVQLPVIVNGRIGKPDDNDVFCFTGRAGEELVAEVTARRLYSPLDSVLKLTDASGRQLALNDDYEDKGAGLLTHQADSLLRIALPADGTYYLHLTDMQHQGGPEYAYRLRISAPRPDFALRLVPSSINARAGGTVPLTVYALRKDGFTDAISLSLQDAPEGFTLGGSQVPAKQDQVRITLTVPSTASQASFRLQLTGHAEIQGRQVTQPIVPAEDMMQAFAYRHLVPSRELKVSVTGREGGRLAVKLLGAGPTRIPAGGTARVRLSVPAGAPLDKIGLQLSDPPEGISLQKVSLSKNGAEILLRSDAEKVQPGQKGNLILAAAKKAGAAGAKAKAGKQKAPPAFTLPAIPFEIIPPQKSGPREE